MAPVNVGENVPSESFDRDDGGEARQNTTDDPPTLLPSRSGPSVIAIKKSQQAPGTKATSSGIADSEDTLPDA